MGSPQYPLQNIADDDAIRKTLRRGTLQLHLVFQLNAPYTDELRLCGDSSLESIGREATDRTTFFEISLNSTVPDDSYLESTQSYVFEVFYSHTESSQEER